MHRPARPNLLWRDSFARKFERGDSVALVGPHSIYVLAAPFGRGEASVLHWAGEQDDAELVGVVHLPDGRDLMTFDRLHRKQSLPAALAEHREYVETVLLVAATPAGVSLQRMQHDTPG